VRQVRAGGRRPGPPPSPAPSARQTAGAPTREEADTVTSSSQPADLARYLARRGFAPSPENPAWLDLGTGQQIIRVLHEPGETTLLYCLIPRGWCLYEAVFSPGTPDAVITAAIEAALSPPQSPAGQPGARAATGRQRARDGKR
jgi:hypothetical protein